MSLLFVSVLVVITRANARWLKGLFEAKVTAIFENRLAHLLYSPGYSTVPLTLVSSVR